MPVWFKIFVMTSLFMMAATIFTFFPPQAWQDSTSMLKTFLRSRAHDLDLSLGGLVLAGSLLCESA